MASHEQVKSPGDVIREMLSVKGWTQAELGAVLGLPPSRVTDLIQNKRNIDPELAVALSEVFFENTAEQWLSIESRYRLSLTPRSNEQVRKRAGLLEIAPIKEMERRGWIKPTSSSDELEAELCRFFETDSLATLPSISGATRKTDSQDSLTPAQRTWCQRVRQLAKSMLVAKFSEERLPECERAIRKLSAYPQEAQKLPALLASFGIRFVVVEPSASCKVDGVAMWLDESWNSPVIGVSFRYDRIDAFWHTVCHELSHIRHHDEQAFDADLTSDDLLLTVKSHVERRADAEAATTLIPGGELESFIQRVGPLYSKDRIVQFAHRIKMHPGVIVGQLQFRKEIGYSANREMLSKLRSIVAPVAITDGWGFTIDQRSLA